MEALEMWGRAFRCSRQPLAAQFRVYRVEVCAFFFEYTAYDETPLEVRVAYAPSAAKDRQSGKIYVAEKAGRR